MLADLHRILAYVAIGLFVVTAATATLSAVRDRRDPTAIVVDAALLGVVAVTSLLGLALLVTGKGPREILHFVYAVVAFAAVPFADIVALPSGDRRRGIARLIGAIVGIAVVARSFATG